jgi:hypothetical protein
MRSPAIESSKENHISRTHLVVRNLFADSLKRIDGPWKGTPCNTEYQLHESRSVHSFGRIGTLLIRSTNEVARAVQRLLERHLAATLHSRGVNRNDLAIR